MVLFLNVLERPVPLEGQPVDPDLRKSWGWWKLKKWTIHILNRLYTRSVSILHFILFIQNNSIFTHNFYACLQFWWLEAAKPWKQGICSNVSQALCGEDFGLPLKSVECHSSRWLLTWQSYQPTSSISNQQVLLYHINLFSGVISYFIAFNPVTPISCSVKWFYFLPSNFRTYWFLT